MPAIWAALLACAVGAWASVPSAPGDSPAENAVLREAVSRTGRLLGLRLQADDRILYERVNPRTGVALAELLPSSASARVCRFLLRLGSSEPEAALAEALTSYLAPRVKPGEPGFDQFLMAAPDGSRRLSPLGKAALMDILTAEDGLRLEEPPPPGPSAPRRTSAILTRSRPGTALAGAAVDLGAFDGVRHAVAAFDWDRLEREVASGTELGRGASASPPVPEASASATVPLALEGYAVDRAVATVRVVIAADRAVRRDRFQTPNAKDGARALREAGLDPRLLDRHGARVVRAVDNIIAVDVPLSRAAGLGKALTLRGLGCSPARVLRPIRAATGALAGPAAAFLAGQLLPLPLQVLRAAASSEALSHGAPPSSDAGRGNGPAPLNLDSRSRLGVDALRREGMEGAQAVIGIIDTGIDASHPDFEGRIIDSIDLTGEGITDQIGHGTHVAGTVAGSGAASDGQYQGMAPKARLLVAKVFGLKGEVSEDVILAAMKWMSAAKEKPDVVNMSLGGPGDPNVDPLGSMANRLAIRDNILVVAAAGNDGPGPASVSSPGNARYVLTVTGVNREGRFPFFPSRGPVEAGEERYAKPDLTAIAGDVNLPATGSLWAEVIRGRFWPAALPAEPTCIYGPGVISTRSADDPDTRCAVAGNPRYRFMTGTSMAAPMAAGIGADVIGYLKSKGLSARSSEVRAALIETAADLGSPREVQGAGIVDGAALAQAVVQRVQHGLPIGNIAYALALRLTTRDREALARQERYRETALGLLDTQTGHLVNTDVELEVAVRWVRQATPEPPPPPPPGPLPLNEREVASARSNGSSVRGEASLDFLGR